MTLSFAADPLNTNAELLEDLQAEVSTGKVGQFTVDTSHVLNVEPKVGKIFTMLHAHLCCGFQMMQTANCCTP